MWRTLKNDGFFVSPSAQAFEEVHVFPVKKRPGISPVF
jgi:hypothetical protein